MQFRGGRIVLALDALLFGGFGALYWVIPGSMAGKVGIKVWICVRPEQEPDVKAGVNRAGNA